ncbi:glycine amidinotransferase [[Kitasatospora] papulosa]|uniref:glycine amidinotransferase n=1 Tax=[Kitasatospora] papulosa TaxID=1464011 RepID=UPI002E329E47|nr:glycine amidinotransferase [[Kitasatospora] papulosa]
MSAEKFDNPAQRVVNSYNGWDPLEEVIVGRVENSASPGFEPALRPYFPAPEQRSFKSARRDDEEIEAATQQLNTLARVLESENVVVRRPTTTDFFTEVKTPSFEVRSQNTSACPRDVLLVVGDEIIEAPMAMRSRFFEYLPYRKLVREYFEQGAKWTAAPKPSMGDEMYVQDFSVADGPFDADEHPALTDLEPCFDAASFSRMGKDIFYQPDIVTNDFGARWLARHLGPEYRLHRVRFRDPHPQHIDATMVPLRAGLVMINPERPPIGDTIAFFEQNGWRVVAAEPSVRGSFYSTPEVSNWISMNVFNVNEETVICEEREKPMIELFKSLGFRVIAIPFTNVYHFGGSFHCCTVDIRRAGERKSYFPALDS